VGEILGRKMKERRGEEMDESVRVFLNNKYCGVYS
jgi:hypothetical protein